MNSTNSPRSSSFLSCKALLSTARPLAALIQPRLGFFWIIGRMPMPRGIGILPMFWVHLLCRGGKRPPAPTPLRLKFFPANSINGKPGRFLFSKSVAAVKKSAFSLIEVVLALAVIAFAITGIMGLFPVALRSAQESQRETRATLIARQIFSDLQTSPATNALIATGTNLASSGNFKTESLSNSWTNSIGYDEAGLPVGLMPTPSANFVANISSTPNVPVSGLSRIQVDVEAPAQAASTNRSKYTFVTLMRQ